MSKTFCCTKCGSTDIYINTTGTQTGLYCSDCGKWIKWLGKEELRLVERQIEELKTENKNDFNKIEIKLNLFIEELKPEIVGGMSMYPSNESIMNKINEIIKEVNQLKIMPSK